MRKEIKSPKIGMGATIQLWSDRIAGTIVRITKTKKTIFIQEDAASRIDRNGISESQRYEYTPNSKGNVYRASLRKYGRFRVSKTNELVSIRVRRKFYDYFF